MSIEENYSRENKKIQLEGKVATRVFGVNVDGEVGINAELDHETYKKTTHINMDVILKITGYAIQIVVPIVLLVALLIMYRQCRNKFNYVLTAGCPPMPFEHGV